MGNIIGFKSGFEGEKYKGNKLFLLLLFFPLIILQVATISMAHELRQ